MVSKLVGYCEALVSNKRLAALVSAQSQEGEKTMHRYWRLAFVVLVGLALVLSSCGPSEQGAEGTPEEPKDEKFGGTLRFGSPYGPTTFDPAYSTEQGGINIIYQVFDRLYTRAGDNSLIPGLAESYENPDSKTWVFHLRQGVTWHDGNEVFAEGESRDVVADDVVYTIERLLAEETASPRKPLVEAVAEAKALDDYTVEIVTKEPDAFFLGNIASVPIVPQEAIEKLGKEGFGRFPIGSGPFEFVEYEPDSHVILQRNEDYWNEPYLDKVEYRVVPDLNSLLVSLESGDVDAIELMPVEEYGRINEDENFVIIDSPTLAYRYAAFNTKNELFMNRDVRKAVTMAIDIDAAVSNIFPEGLAVRAYGPVPPHVMPVDDKLQDYWTYDPEGAAQLLAEAGWEDSDGDGVLDKDGQAFAITIKTPGQDRPRTKFGVIIADELQKLGIAAEPQPLEWGTLIADMNSGNTDMYICGGFSGDNGIIFLFHSRNQGSAGNSSFYENPEVDRLLDLGAITVDPEEHQEIWYEAQRLIVQDYPHIPLYHQKWFGVASARVHDMANFILVDTERNTWIEE